MALEIVVNEICKLHVLGDGECTGSGYWHECTKDQGHVGYHTCGCGYTWIGPDERRELEKINARAFAEKIIWTLDSGKHFDAYFGLENKNAVMIIHALTKMYRDQTVEIMRNELVKGLVNERMANIEGKSTPGA